MKKSVKQIVARNKQQGQMLVMSLLLIIVSLAIVQMVFRVGLINSEKEQLVNAADAAAYSGGIFFARHLNFLAYTNRAMLANHVAVGHYISYLSWIRYAHDSVKKIDRLANFFPSGKTITRVAKELIRNNKLLAERVSPRIVNLANQINSFIAVSQLKSQFTMNGVLSISPLSDVKIMDRVAKTHHPLIRVNYKQDVQDVYPDWIREQIFTDMKATLQYVKRYSAGSDGGKIYRVINNEYREDDQWIRGNRGWKLGIGKLGIFKQGDTKLKGNGDSMGWYAEDELYMKKPALFRKKTTRVAFGKASTDEYRKKYKGITHYYDRRSINNVDQIRMTALATRPTDHVDDMDGSGRLWAVSRVEVVYQKPEYQQKYDEKIQFSTLYNPYWHVRLTKNGV